MNPQNAGNGSRTTIVEFSIEALVRSAILSLVGLILLPGSSLQASDLKVGFAEFNRNSDGGSPAATALFSLTNPDGVLVSEAGVGARVPTNQGRIFVQQTDKVGTGLALANPSDKAVFLDLVLRDQNGHEVGKREDFKIEPHQHLARFVAELFQNVSSPFTGSLTFAGVTSADKVAAVTLRQTANGEGEPLLTTLPVIDLDQGSASGNGEKEGQLIFPHIGAGPGFSTQLILISRSETETSGKIYLTSSDGGDLRFLSQIGIASTIPYEIAPSGVFFIELDVPPGGTLGVGYARIEVTQGVLPSGSAIFRFTESQQPVSEAGVGAPPAMRRTRLFVDTRETSTGFALVNAHSDSLAIALRLFDANGRFIEERNRSLPAMNHFAEFVSETFELPDRFVGLLEIQSSQSFIPITLKLTQNGRGNSILTTLPVADLNSLSDERQLVFPQVAAGDSTIGSFLTRLIFIAPLQESLVTGNLRFWEGLGQPLLLGLFDGELETVVEGGALGELRFSDKPLEAEIKRGVTISEEIDSAGGVITLEDCGGSLIRLEIPPFALTSPREIRVSCLESRPVDTLGRNIFPGISLEPEGLFFLHPARLSILLPEPVERVERASILTLGLGGIPRPTTEAFATGQLLTGKIRHFSEYWGDDVNFHDLLGWAGSFGQAVNDPELREAVIEGFRKTMGFEIDLEVLNYLERLHDISGLLELERLKSRDGKVPVGSRNLMEVLTLEFLASSVPQNPCGQFHSLTLSLREMYEDIFGVPLPDLDNRIALLDSQCIRTDLSGEWRSDSITQSETCWYPNDPFSPWTETEKTGSYEFLITQQGSSFTISIPDYPGAPTWKGQVHGTGGHKILYYFTITADSAQSADCHYFFETDGSFDFGDPLCEEDEYFGCRALSCNEIEWMQGIVSAEGDRLEGDTRWLFGASALQVPKINPCVPSPCILSISCDGSGFFTWRKQ